MSYEDESDEAWKQPPEQDASRRYQEAWATIRRLRKFIGTPDTFIAQELVKMIETTLQDLHGLPESRSSAYYVAELEGMLLHFMERGGHD